MTNISEEILMLWKIRLAVLMSEMEKEKLRENGDVGHVHYKLTNFYSAYRDFLLERRTIQQIMESGEL